MRVYLTDGGSMERELSDHWRERYGEVSRQGESVGGDGGWGEKFERERE